MRQRHLDETHRCIFRLSINIRTLQQYLCYQFDCHHQDLPKWYSNLLGLSSTLVTPFPSVGYVFFSGFTWFAGFRLAQCTRKDAQDFPFRIRKFTISRLTALRVTLYDYIQEVLQEDQG